MNTGLGSRFYMPVLRWRAAETTALAKLAPEVRQYIFPIMELCPPTFIRARRTKDRKDVKESRPISVLSEKLSRIKDAIREQVIGIDLLHINDAESAYSCNSLWSLILTTGKAINLRVVPTTGFYGKGIPYQELVGAVAKVFGNGLCLRVRVRDLNRNSFSQDIDKLLSLVGHEPENIDLVVDLQLVDREIPQSSNIIRRLPYMTRWRSFVLLGGSFPLDLSHLRANNTYDIPRVEWTSWQKQYIDSGSHQAQVPAFGDYTIQHPFYREPVSNPHVSASIRYTTSDHWVVFRGEWIGKQNGSGCAQYPAQAELLVARPRLFSGAKFSFGDEYILQKSIDGSRPGNPENWLTAGINHHITYTVCQIHPELQATKQKIAISTTNREEPDLTKTDSKQTKTTVER